LPARIFAPHLRASWTSTTARWWRRWELAQWMAAEPAQRHTSGRHAPRRAGLVLLDRDRRAVEPPAVRVWM
jgi:hypothetical protein